MVEVLELFLTIFFYSSPVCQENSPKSGRSPRKCGGCYKTRTHKAVEEQCLAMTQVGLLCCEKVA